MGSTGWDGNHSDLQGRSQLLSFGYGMTIPARMYARRLDMRWRSTIVSLGLWDLVAAG
ncbi:MAG TPA: hypothetical protein V6D20_00360 [Candidatus Obscuribacterales bacterium]